MTTVTASPLTTSVTISPTVPMERMSKTAVCSLSLFIFYDNDYYCHYYIGVGRFRILGGQGLDYWGGGGLGGQTPSRHMTS